MSKALDIAELIRTRLITAPAVGELETPVDLTELPEESVIVDRQKDINTMTSVAVAKAKGTAIVILWDGQAVADENAKRPRVELSYNISVHSKPVIAAGDFPADDVMESIINRLWHWVPQGRHQQYEVKIRPGGLVPHKSFLIYDLGAVIVASH